VPSWQLVANLVKSFMKPCVVNLLFCLRRGFNEGANFHLSALICTVYQFHIQGNLYCMDVYVEVGAKRLLERLMARREEYDTTSKVSSIFPDHKNGYLY